MSTSFSMVPYNSATCNHFHQHPQGCNNSQSQYKADFLDSTFMNGSLVLEKLTFGSTLILNVFFGCNHSNNGRVPVGTNAFRAQCYLAAGTAWIPLLPNPNTDTYYYVRLSGLGIGDIQIPIPKNSFKMTNKALGEQL
ncbi:hypothetical protein FH972_013240 [Carpinus fangiana]|uniref:Xylanase inhibitor N-terminal domain-containing protein n=1 Tax=Carpinus fangiana TaxID=176857 RepID=A0A5N6R9J6_9ROSI|nr:hypothetical protein FH972_013240 [Carpinus fangiana]